MSTLHIPLWAWAATIAALAALIGADLIVSARRRGPVQLREAALWTLASVLAAVGFGAVLATVSGTVAAGQFYAGWLTEYSLSLDNLFVFLLLISGSSVARRHHGRVLLLGILTALVLRAAFIAAGAAALREFGWAEYVFGAFLLGTALAMFWRRNRGDDGHEQDSRASRAVKRVVPVASGYRGGELTTKVNGRRLATPVLILVLAIGVTDVMFAFDSIPAIFGLTRDPFLVFTANLFALLGLRHLYFLIGGLLGRLAHLTTALAVILAFIGLKIVGEGLRGAGISHLGPVPLPQVGPLVSLAVIGGVLLITAVTSLAAGRRAGRPGPPGALLAGGQTTDPARPATALAQPAEEAERALSRRSHSPGGPAARVRRRGRHAGAGRRRRSAPSPSPRSPAG